eukprot:TRINITY_DN43119_c0_g1_i1.p1 TRINITY_DN43119_c0_g1~~TRINITY_DN43119_c0_g1_i1.p1  ORF type:complete len:344 (-),score=25.93 TRINITY_DN43119_c0_g1_i1:42-1073(-)
MMVERMTVLAAAAAVVHAASALAPCTTASDCSLGGVCTAGSCVCWPTWTGPNCSVLNVLPSPATCAGAWRRPANQSSWGGSVVRDDAGLYHMVSADMEAHCGLDSWQRNSRIVHLTSAKPTGPFVQSDVVLDAFAHNPTLHRAPDGTWLVYHIGNGVPDSHGPPLKTCTHGVTPPSTVDDDARLPPPLPLDVGDEIAPNLLWAARPSGPWNDGRRIAGDAKSCNNPGPYIFSNGTVLLVCKVTSGDGQKIRQMAIAVAPSWEGPYTVRSLAPVYGEDAYVFRQPQDGNLHMLLHLSLIHISEPTRLLSISYAVFCLKKKKKLTNYDYELVQLYNAKIKQYSYM